MWVKLEQYVFLTASWLKRQADKWKQTQLYVNERGLVGGQLLPTGLPWRLLSGLYPTPLPLPAFLTPSAEPRKPSLDGSSQILQPDLLCLVASCGTPCVPGAVPMLSISWSR